MEMIAMTNTFAEGLLVCLGILVAVHAYSHSTSIKQQELARLRLQQLLAQSELRALRVQCEPHFLFNALQGISTLIETNPLTAQTMLRRLSTLLRAVLQHGAGDLVRFREEIAILRAYVDLQQMRLGSRLSVLWLLDPEAGASLIPQLILQPLVENAIVHGVAPAPDGGWISIEAYCRDDRLVVEIRNSVTSLSQAGMRMGLANIRARLTHLYAQDAEFAFTLLSETKVAVARLVVPAFATPTEGASGASRIQ
jgi:two-component system LytT family sensor kinase